MPNQPKDLRVKRLGDEILNHVRAWLDRECKEDLDFRFLVIGGSSRVFKEKAEMKVKG